MWFLNIEPEHRAGLTAFLIGTVLAITLAITNATCQIRMDRNEKQAEVDKIQFYTTNGYCQVQKAGESGVVWTKCGDKK